MKSRIEIYGENLAQYDVIYGIRKYKSYADRTDVLSVFEFESPKTPYDFHTITSIRENAPAEDQFIAWFTDLMDLQTFESHEDFSMYVIHNLFSRGKEVYTWQEVVNALLVEKLSGPSPIRNPLLKRRIDIVFNERLYKY